MSDDFSKACDLDDRGNHEDEFAIFNTLAANGDVSSMTRLALMYGEGIGVEKDIAKSIYWDKKAIDQGDVVGMINLGITYRSIGDTGSAKALFERALQSGDPEGGIELLKTTLAQSPLAADVADIVRQIDRNIGHATPDSVQELAVIRKWFGIKSIGK